MRTPATFFHFPPLWRRVRRAGRQACALLRVPHPVNPAQGGGGTHSTSNTMISHLINPQSRRTTSIGASGHPGGPFSSRNSRVIASPQTGAHATSSIRKRVGVRPGFGNAAVSSALLSLFGLTIGVALSQSLYLFAAYFRGCATGIDGNSPFGVKRFCADEFSHFGSGQHPGP